jgi:hypothetical protein
LTDALPATLALIPAFKALILDLVYQNRSIGPKRTPGSARTVQTCHSTDPNLHRSLVITAPTERQPRHTASTTITFSLM